MDFLLDYRPLWWRGGALGGMIDGISEQLLLLIGQVYDCALDPSLWDATLARIAAIVDCRTAALALWNPLDGRLLLSRSAGMSPHELEQMAQYSPEISQMVAAFAPASEDEPHILSRHVPLEYRRESPYVRDCLTPGGIVDVMQLPLMCSPARRSALGLGRNERQGTITDREIALARLLMPHVRRAVTISNVLDIRTIESTRALEALDALRCAIVLTDGHGVILHANQSAEAMLRRGSPIERTAGVLQASIPEAAHELRVAITLATEDAAMGKTGLAIRLVPDEKPPVFAHVLPLTGGELRTRLDPAAVAAVFIGPPPDEQAGATAIAEAFGLTPAETRVLAGLLAGRTLAETAATLAIAASTANTHLDRIFAKTGVSRQSELVRLGTSLIPPTSGT